MEDYKEVDKHLNIKTSYDGKYSAWIGDLAGVSIRGRGRSEDDAILDLYRRLAWTSKSHMDKVQRRLKGENPEDLDVNVGYEFRSDGRLILWISDAQGRSTKRVARWKPRKKR